jgi:hypothetical protein
MWKAAIAAVAVLWPIVAAHAQNAAPPRLELRPGIWFEVTELKRLDKNIVGLRFAVDNQSAESTTLSDLGLSDNGQRVTDLKLIDFQGGKDYWIGSTGGSCLCSTFSDGAPVGPGERQTFWAWFGAPPAGVTKLAVFVPGVPPMFDVPLAR